ncbi:MAG: hypothetical protein ACK5QW_01460 [Cyanobacteriota bacterium]
MSNLRRIMQKIADAQNNSQQIPSSMNGDSVQISEPHLQDYTSKIEQCSEGMLRYEWAWLEEHIEDLELCLVQPEMLKILGGTIQVERLLLESKKCQDFLRVKMEERGIRPTFHSHSIISGEHAWQVSQDNVKQMWGF